MRGSLIVLGFDFDRSFLVLQRFFYRSLKKNLRWKNQQSKMKSFATVEKGDEHKMQQCLSLNLDLGTYLIDGLG